MRIGEREIGPGHPAYVIAEIGVNHDGEVTRALQLTEAAASAGADAVKLQYFETDRLLSKAAKLAAYQRAAGETDPVAMLRRLELTLDEMALVVDRAHALGIHAIVTVFSVELVKPASGLAWDAYKSASPDVINRPLLDALAGTGKPLIVSTGASTMEEVVRAVGWLEGIRDRLAVLQCVSSYPTEELELGGIRVIHKETGLPTGYSDHTPSHRTAVHASAAGACILEKHITDDRRREGPDHAASLPLLQLPAYMEAARAGANCREAFDEARGLYARARGELESAAGVSFMKSLAEDDYRRLYNAIGAEGLHRACEAVERKRVVECERDVREVARQSLTTTRALGVGESVAREDLTIKRPGVGIQPFRRDEIVGRKLARAVDADMPLMEADLENQPRT